MPHTPLTQEEALWIRDLARALMCNEDFTTPAPTDHVVVYVFKHIK